MTICDDVTQCATYMKAVTLWIMKCVHRIRNRLNARYPKCVQTDANPLRNQATRPTRGRTRMTSFLVIKMLEQYNSGPDGVPARVWGREKIRRKSATTRRQQHDRAVTAIFPTKDMRLLRLRRGTRCSISVERASMGAQQQGVEAGDAPEAASD
jgi:hypothetical protein